MTYWGWFRLLGVALGGVALIGLLGCGSGVVVNTITTTVAPLPTDDLAGPCVYETPLPYDTAPQVAVLVIFDRGDDGLVFDDAAVREAMYTQHITVVYAHECDAKSFGDLQPDATKGPGRALFAALGQFATATGHPELAQARVILFGFSAAGVLAATTLHAYPDRVMGALPFAPGSAFLNLDTLAVSAADARVPVLVMGNAGDQLAGTTRGLNYFHRGRGQGGVWGFAVQNETPHCCALSTVGLILPWISSVVGGAGGRAGVLSYFKCQPDGSGDGQGLENCEILDASLTGPLTSMDESGWLPDEATADAWLSWVTNPKTN